MARKGQRPGKKEKGKETVAYQREELQRKNEGHNCGISVLCRVIAENWAVVSQALNIKLDNTRRVMEDCWPCTRSLGRCILISVFLTQDMKSVANGNTTVVPQVKLLLSRKWKVFPLNMLSSTRGCHASAVYMYKEEPRISAGTRETIWRREK